MKEPVDTLDLTNVDRALAGRPKPDGGPAFPHAGRDDLDSQEGMSLRDYFAAKAMHAELVSAGSFEEPATALAEAAEEADQTIKQRIAWLSYEMADAMLAERAK